MLRDAALWAGVYFASVFAVFGLLVWLGCRRVPGQGAPRWAPDAAMVEDAEVAELDALYEMESARPGAW
jgi:hypothetical protein